MMRIFEDTRQKKGKHELKRQWFEAHGIEVVPCAIPFGDYALPPLVSIDTKASIAEIHGNLTAQHDRFRNELIRAQESGSMLVILIENDCGIYSLPELACWIEPEWMMKRRHGKKQINGADIAEKMTTMQRKYGCRFAFCQPERSAYWIAEMLAHPEEVTIDNGFICKRARSD